MLAATAARGEVFGDPPIGGIGWSTLSFSQGFICGDEASAFVKEGLKMKLEIKDFVSAVGCVKICIQKF